MSKFTGQGDSPEPGGLVQRLLPEAPPAGRTDFRRQGDRALGQQRLVDRADGPACCSSDASENASAARRGSAAGVHARSRDRKAWSSPDQEARWSVPVQAPAGSPQNRPWCFCAAWLARPGEWHALGRSARRGSRQRGSRPSYRVRHTHGHWVANHPERPGEGGHTTALGG